MKQYRITTLIGAVPMFILGLIFSAHPELSVQLICYSIAALTGVMTAIELFQSAKLRRVTGSISVAGYASAIFFVVLTVILLLQPHSITSMIPVILGILIILGGVLIIGSGVLYRGFLPRNGIYTFGLGAIAILLGVICFAVRLRFEYDTMIIRFIGISMLFTSIASLVNFVMVNRAASLKEEAEDKAYEENNEEKEDEEQKLIEG